MDELTDALKERVKKNRTQKKNSSYFPALYRVVLHNDHYTPMDFVVNILKTIFHKNNEDAVNLMLAIHKNGQAVAGVYTREIADTKRKQVQNISKQNQYPLKASIQKEP